MKRFKTYHSVQTEIVHELKECPFCHERKKLKVSVGTALGTYVSCDMCKSRGSVFYDGAEEATLDAVATWNKARRIYDME